VLCHRTGGDQLVGRFIDACAAAGRRFPFTVDCLNRMMAAPELYGRELAHGPPSAMAKRKLFNLACALLDLETVGDMLAAGTAISTTGSVVRHSLTQV